MNYRRQEADKAHPDTCGWIFTHDSFTQWNSRDRGLLWIKGKPGAGKSTLMALVHHHFQDKPAGVQDLGLDFFFHGRGTVLQKIPLGMFRSLLHQVYSREPSVREPIRRTFDEKKGFGEAGKDWEWHPKELQDLLFNAVVRAAELRRVTIFVDALDEAGSEAEALVEYFHKLNDRLVQTNGIARVCISCRHYPIPAIAPGLEIWVEKNNQKDISIFVQAELRLKLQAKYHSPDSSAWRDLEQHLAQQASGVFQWIGIFVFGGFSRPRSGFRGPRELTDR